MIGVGGTHDVPIVEDLPLAIEFTLPIEFVVDGVPKSAQRGGGGANDEWKAKVREAAERTIGSGREPVRFALLASCYIFPRDRLPGDLNNKLKFIFDALVDLVYESDSQIKRLDVRAFEPDLGMSYRIASALLNGIAAGGERCVYLRFSTDLNEEL